MADTDKEPCVAEDPDSSEFQCYFKAGCAYAYTPDAAVHNCFKGKACTSASSAGGDTGSLREICRPDMDEFVFDTQCDLYQDCVYDYSMEVFIYIFCSPYIPCNYYICPLNSTLQALIDQPSIIIKTTSSGNS